MKKLLVICVVLLTGCGGSTTSSSTTSPSKKIDCQAEELYGTKMLKRTFFGFSDDGAWSKLQDGEVTATLKSNISKGQFKKNDMQMVPYIKSGNAFNPKYPQHWDVLSPEENVDTAGDVVIECIVTAVVPVS